MYNKIKFIFCNVALNPMPQLDFLVFSLEIFYNAFYFILFYLVILYFLTPKFFFAIRNRSRLNFWLFKQNLSSKKLTNCLTNISIFLLEKLSLFGVNVLVLTLHEVSFDLLNYNFFGTSYLLNNSTNIENNSNSCFFFLYKNKN